MRRLTTKTSEEEALTLQDLQTSSAPPLQHKTLDENAPYQKDNAILQDNTKLLNRSVNTKFKNSVLIEGTRGSALIMPQRSSFISNFRGKKSFAMQNASFVGSSSKGAFQQFAGGSLGPFDKNRRLS